ncbi:MAG TPA: HupE/UreJ family protein [Burkholderiales bacterium]|nr:HupE/UreJ family protein [Burkholderiales bacterium]
MKSRARILVHIAMLLLACLAFEVRADVFRPAYLEIRETAADQYDVLWKVPAQGELRLAAQVGFPEDVRQLTPPVGIFSDGAYVERWRIQRNGGLAGQVVRIKGVAAGVTDVIARVEREDGGSQLERLPPERLEFVIKGPSSSTEIARSYLVLGVGHILHGMDHLLFVFALLLIVRGGRRIFFTITAFTLAHSITLVAATLGWIRVPGPPVEAVVALSIVFVAAEIVSGLRGHAGLTARAPWAVAFGFGLLHGLGFASALSQIGLPQQSIPLALAMFNVGVEVGQLVFVAAVLPLHAVVARATSNWPGWTRYLAPYAIGTVAMFWVIDRVGAFWIA